MYAVAIDGPAGAGKSTISRAVAQKIGFLYVDTGALYRAVAYDMLENRINLSDIHAVCERLAHITVRLGYENGDQQIYLNGKNITEKIRTPQISAAASTVSSIGEVRQFLFSLQQDIARVRELGLEAHLARLEEKQAILDELLAHYNDGRRKTLFNTAVYLLPLEELRSVMDSLNNWPELGEPAGKKRALAAAQLLQAAADRQGISLKLNKKPKKG